MEFSKMIQIQINQLNDKLRKTGITVKKLQEEDDNKSKIVILKGQKIKDNYEVIKVSKRTICILKEGEILERKLFIGYLGKWLYNIYNDVEYLYVFYGGELNRKVLTKTEVYKISKGIFNENQNKAYINQKYVIEQQPEVKGYLGPVFEEIDYGKIYLRYETKEIYNMLLA